MKQPFGWLKKIGEYLQEENLIPLFGNGPHFDLARFSSLASSRLGAPSLSFKVEKQSFLTPTELKKGLGGKIVTIPIKVGPLAGSAFWMMPKEEIKKLTTWMLLGQTKQKGISSEILMEGFYRYLLLQMFDVASEIEPFNHLSLLLSEESGLPAEDTFCIDLEIEMENRSCWGRLAIDPELKKSWVSHFSSFKSDYISTKKAQGIELDLSVKIGGTLVTHKEWKSLETGDALLLDRESYDPSIGKGMGTFVLGTIPLFQAKIKENKLELLDYAFGDEMEKKKPMQNEDSSEEEVGSIKDSPIYVTVELARVKMSLEKLMQLQPGNMLELPFTSNELVQLRVGGNLVGRGELVQLGDALGVRIIEI